MERNQYRYKNKPHNQHAINYSAEISKTRDKLGVKQPFPDPFKSEC